MTSISVKRFNWVQTPSAWEQNQAYRERLKALREDFEAANSTMSTGFANASINQLNGMATIIANVTIARLQKEQAAKQAKFLDMLA